MTTFKAVERLEALSLEDFPPSTAAPLVPLGWPSSRLSASNEKSRPVRTGRLSSVEAIRRADPAYSLPEGCSLQRKGLAGFRGELRQRRELAGFRGSERVATVFTVKGSEHGKTSKGFGS